MTELRESHGYSKGRTDGAMAKTRDRVSGAAGNVKPYVERAVSDEELRENVKAAFQAAREVYDELIGDRGVTTVATRVATDKDIQDKLRDAVDELRSRSGPRPGQEGPLRPQRDAPDRRHRARHPLQPGDGPGHAQVARRRRLRRRRLHVREPGRTTARAARTQPRPRSPALALVDRLESSASASPPGVTGASARRSEPGSSPLALEMSEI